MINVQPWQGINMHESVARGRFDSFVQNENIIETNKTNIIIR